MKKQNIKEFNQSLLSLVENAGLLVIAIATVFAMGAETITMVRAMQVTLTDLLLLFLYLEVLDASFSFDGVIGAFAITKDVVIIMLGLAIGAMFVRSLTVYLVRKGTLDEYVFLEHGAHYAIGSLAAIMLISMTHHISEVVTGLVGAVLFGLSVFSSVLYRRKHAE